MRLSNKQTTTQTIIEQIALLFASFVWTVVVLSVITMFWVYQDVNARWAYLSQTPPEAMAQAIEMTATPTPTSTSSPTPWAGPGPTLTPTSTSYPTPTPTRVVAPPAILPQTFNIDEPTPAPVPVETEQEAAPTPVQPPEPAQPTPAQPPAPAPAQPVPQPAAAPSSNLPAPAGAAVPSHLVIESVNIDSPITPVGWQVVEQLGQQYSIWEVADYAVGWHKTSAYLGLPGNTVMAGHHNVNGEVFRDLVNVEVGDKVVVYAGEQKFEYVVEMKTIVKEKGEPIEVRQRNAQWISATDDERLTLVTCWPYTNNTHRVIVVAKPL